MAYADDAYEPKVIGSVPISRMEKGNPWNPRSARSVRSNPTRRNFLSIGTAAAFGPAFAIGTAAAAEPPPTDWGLSSGGYIENALIVLRHMRFCANQEKGDPSMDLYNKNMKKEMTDFNSFFLANTKGGPAINDLRSDVSILATHYTNAGFSSPLKPDQKEKLLASISSSEKIILVAKEALAAGPTSAAPRSSSAKQMETTPDGKRKSSEDIKQEKYGNDNSEKSAAMQARLKASNPDAFKGEGFKVKF
eukprot:CAMPEP_0172599722 /NCGR_PEP_ID=MMETSP1068-20121228/19839_1 /TAXON_ID=35684 /ORGANISM="Pseudopedinella elastica, Strain CCMP716" /LENGTH=248 /DNA_ID=CAMNT_0013400073 /DNA_START=151 /DNA_END=897 /DNA_ORIENTATION=+